MNSKKFYTPVQLKQMFNGKKVSPTLPYDSPLKTNDLGPRVFENSLKYISILKMEAPPILQKGSMLKRMERSLR